MMMVYAKKMWTILFPVFLLAIVKEQTVMALSLNSTYTSSNVLVEFGDFSDMNVSPGEIILKIEIDLANENCLLAGTIGTIQTITETSNTILVGKLGASGYQNGVGEEVRMRSGGILQLNSEVVLFADSPNHCIRRLYRSNRSVEDFVGSCTVVGNEDGIGTAARLERPGTLTIDPKDSNLLYFLSSNNPVNALGEIDEGNRFSLIRSLNLTTKQVKVLYKSTLESVPFMRWDPFYPNSLITTNGTYLYRFDLSSRELCRLTGASSNFNIYDYSRGIDDLLVLDRDLYLISEVIGDCIQLIDITEQKAYSSYLVESCTPNTICLGLYNIRNIARSNSTLYFTHADTIRALSVKVTPLPTMQLAAQSTTSRLVTGDCQASAEYGPATVADTICATDAEGNATAVCTKGCFSLMADGKLSFGCVENINCEDHGIKVVDCDDQLKLGNCFTSDNGEKEMEVCIKCCTDGRECNKAYKEMCDYVECTASIHSIGLALLILVLSLHI